MVRIFLATKTTLRFNIPKENTNYNELYATKGPLLYLIFTADLPTTEHTTTATFADDTGLLAVHSDPDVASQRLQNHLTLLHDWFEKWKIRTCHLHHATRYFISCLFAHYPDPSDI